MPLIHDSEMEDFQATLLRAGFEVGDFNVVKLEDEPTVIEQLEYETAIKQYVPTGTVTIHRISTDEAITYSAGHLSTWVAEFEINLHEGKFGPP